MSTERKPLLSDEELHRIGLHDSPRGGNQLATYKRVEVVRAFYEAKITSGELRVVETAILSDLESTRRCACGYWGNRTVWGIWNFCPGCGAKIVKA